MLEPLHECATQARRNTRTSAAAPYAQAANRKNADKKIVVENDAKQKCFG